MNRLVTAAGSLVDRIKINSIAREVRDGRTVWIKRRRASAIPIMACANIFFRLAGARLRAIREPEVWQRWEIGCFARLHGSRYRAFADGPGAVAAEELPGVNLTLHLDGGTINPRMAAAAARELRRAHELPCEEFGAAWSHGDPHIGNFVYDEAAERARLIDFEVMHDGGLSADERHADDLLVFLQDMVGRIRAELWMPCARAFLDTYDRPEIVALMLESLVVPRGMARVWWAVRTSYMAPAELRRRLAALRGKYQSPDSAPGSIADTARSFAMTTHSPTG